MTESETRSLSAILHISERLHHIKDLDSLLDRVLLEARRVTGADAGSIYLLKDNRLTFEYVQNDTLKQRDRTSNRYIYAKQELPVDESSLAGYAASTRRPLAIEDVYRLAAGSPYRFNRSFDQQADYRTRAVLTVPLITSRDQVIGVLQVINPKDSAGRETSFRDNDLLTVGHLARHAGSAIEKARMTREIILRMVKMAELRDPGETGAHVNRVGAYSIEIYQSWAQRQGVPEPEVKHMRDTLRIAAMLHDIGKIGVSDTILKKRRPLKAEEYEQIKMHTLYGARLFADSTSDWDDMATTIALNHHERWDGAGYPGPLEDLHSDRARFTKGKKGTDIPLPARIVALADVYDALISPRSYKEPWKEQRILDYLNRQRGGHFDPQLVDAFFDIQDIIMAIRRKFGS